MDSSERFRIEHLTPDGLAKNPAYSQAVAVSGPARTVYVGGQNATDSTGAIVGVGDLKQQTVRALENVQTALRGAGADLQHVVKWTISLVHGQPLTAAYQAYQQVWGNRGQPGAVSMALVSGLARPEFLVEIDAIAVVPEG